MELPIGSWHSYWLAMHAHTYSMHRMQLAPQTGWATGQIQYYIKSNLGKTQMTTKKELVHGL